MPERKRKLAALTEGDNQQGDGNEWGDEGMNGINGVWMTGLRMTGLGMIANGILSGLVLLLVRPATGFGPLEAGVVCLRTLPTPEVQQSSNCAASSGANVPQHTAKN